LDEDLDHILAHTRECWEELRGQSIFITGATGFFGRWLLESFAHANKVLQLKSRVVALSRDPDAFRVKAPHLAADPAIQFVTGDVRKMTAEDVRTQLGATAPTRYQFIIHAATEASARLNEANPLLMIDTIVEGTRAALEFAAATRASRFLLTSSGAVYGRQPPELSNLTEDYTGGPDCIDPASAYAEAKRLAELLCVCFGKRHGLEPVIARAFAFAGPFLPTNAHFAIGNFVRDALSGGPIKINGDGTAVRSYLYAADLAIWLWTILVKGKPFRPYNVGSADPLTISELAEAVRKQLGDNIAISGPQKPVTSAGPSRYVPSVQRATSELGLIQRISLGESLRRFARHEKATSQ
jgi:dTDP-glucose 4,6-dehydratase